MLPDYEQNISKKDTKLKKKNHYYLYKVTSQRIPGMKY